MAEESPRKKFKSMTLSLQKAVECPVCIETLKVPFKLCSNGHGVCNECNRCLKKCPVCQRPFVLENPVFLKNILEVFPQLCRYSEKGCEEVFEIGNDHEFYCGYRPIRCRDCETNVEVHNLLEHYETIHQGRVIVKSQYDSFINTGGYINIGKWSNFDPKSKREDSIPVFLFSSWFWIVMAYDNERNELKLSFQLVPTKKPVDDYYCKVKFTKDEYIFIYTIKASCLGVLIGLSNNDGRYYMTIPIGTLNIFVQNSEFKYGVNISKKSLRSDKPEQDGMITDGLTLT